MGTGSSDLPRAEAASADEVVCALASDSASPKASRSHCSRFSLHRCRDEQHTQHSSQLRRQRRSPVHAARSVGSKMQRSISKRQQQLQDLETDLLCLRILNELLPDQVCMRAISSTAEPSDEQAQHCSRRCCSRPTWWQLQKSSVLICRQSCSLLPMLHTMQCTICRCHSAPMPACISLHQPSVLPSVLATSWLAQPH
jgi:hypothetical protein